MHTEPFPFAALEAVTREEVRLAKALRRAAAPLVRPSAIAAALSELLHERVEVVVRRIRRFDPKRCAPESIAVAVAPAETTGLSAAALVEIEASLAASIVARALKHKLARVVDASRAPSPELVGAVAAVVIATMRRAHAGTPLRVVAAGPAHALGHDLAGAHRSIATAWLTVIVGADAFDARVSVPESVLGDNEARRLEPSDLARLGVLPIALPLVVATTLAARADLSALARGDAFIIPSFPLKLEGEALTGPVGLVPPRSEHGLGADLAADGRLVLRGLLEVHPWEKPMSEPTTTTVEVLEDAPVVVRVELGTIEMKAREWADIAPGDVVALGRKLGAPAILRVAGVEVARGELVQIDGEYGVRILGTQSPEER